MNNRYYVIWPQVIGMHHYLTVVRFGTLDPLFMQRMSTSDGTYSETLHFKAAQAASDFLARIQARPINEKPTDDAHKGVKYHLAWADTWQNSKNGFGQGGVHVILDEDFSSGRLNRKAGQVLCNVNPWDFSAADYKGAPTEPTCKECKARMERYDIR